MIQWVSVDDDDDEEPIDDAANTGFLFLRYDVFCRQVGHAVAVGFKLPECILVTHALLNTHTLSVNQCTHAHMYTRASS